MTFLDAKNVDLVLSDPISNLDLFLVPSSSLDIQRGNFDVVCQIVHVSDAPDSVLGATFAATDGAALLMIDLFYCLEMKKVHRSCIKGDVKSQKNVFVISTPSVDKCRLAWFELTAIVAVCSHH